MNLQQITAMRPQTFMSYNVNGIRAAMQKGLADWIGNQLPDVLGMQEIKALPEQIDHTPWQAMGYETYWFPAQKKGYSGVALLTRIKPDRVVMGMGNSLFDDEGRIIRADFGDLTVLSCYFPSGTSGELRQQVKYDFLAAFDVWIAALLKERPQLIVMGDYNIAHTEKDIHDPKGNKKTSGFLPEERAWMTQFLASGFIDSFRHVHPDLQKYSWWSFRAGARSNNKGWRIDYCTVSTALADKIAGAELYNQAEHSDHCACSLRLHPD